MDSESWLDEMHLKLQWQFFFFLAIVIKQTIEMDACYPISTQINSNAD